MLGEAEARRKSCTGKNRYETRRIAQLALKGYQSVGKGAGLQSYRCPWCDGWHLGHGRQKWQKRSKWI